jgi:hypothetical protein
MHKPPADGEAVFQTYAQPIRQKMNTLRTLIFDTAAEQAVGPLTETLK